MSCINFLPSSLPIYIPPFYHTSYFSRGAPRAELPIKSVSKHPLPSSPTYLPCIPKEAAEILDRPAQAMLQRLQSAPLQTPYHSPIYTSHVISAQTSPSANPLLFLHGFDSNLLEYRYMLPLLDEYPYLTAHFLDLLGWGLTDKPIPSSFSYTPQTRREHLRAYHDQVMDSKPMVLVGASIGGAAAIDFALEYPHRVSKLILLDPQAFVDKPASRFLQLFPAFASIGAEILRSDWLRRAAINIAYHDDKFKCDDVLRIGGLHCRTSGWKEAAVNLIQEEGYCLSDRVAQIKCPTLVLWGEFDRVLQKKDAMRFRQVPAVTNFEFVKDCGHSPHIERPDIVTSRVLEFLKTG